VTPPEPDAEETRPVSLRPPADRALRDAGRLIAMVHELHKAGYQRVRICPSMAPNGLHWRCRITHAGNVGEDGYTPCSGPDGHVAAYSSGQGANYFGWPGADRMTARQLAARFIEAYPLIAERGAGRDWLYAGWLTDLLGHAEQGKFVAFYADYPIDEETLRRWAPPPVPDNEGLVVPRT
jgi:hypothetical protein